MFASTLALAISFLSATAAADLPYQELADRFLATHQLTGKTPEQVEISALLESEFFMTRVGLFEVWIPSKDLKGKETARDYRDICAALCSAQEHWIAWLGEGAQNAPETLAGFKAHREWVEKWSLSELAKAEEAPTRTALALFAAPEEVAAQSARLGSTMQSGAILGDSIEAAGPVRLMLMPERKEFVEFLAFTGWLFPDQQSNFWVPGIETWTEFRLNDLQVIAMQYPATAPVEGDYSGSTSMKDRDIKGLEQQVVQLGMNKLMAYLHGDAMPTPVISGISISLLIEMYGTCHTRNDGDMRGRTRAKREVFIRGGQSEGGQLPQNVAESRWRTDYGKHHYTRILRQVQKSGSSYDKRNKHKFNAFLLVGDDEATRFVMHAPIFGAGNGEVKTPPPAAHGDHLEFLRAYNVAFMFWLQTTAGGAKKKSEQAFAQFLSSVKTSTAEKSLASTLEEIYGMPLSNPEADEKCLEGRFIKWISKQ